MLTVLGGGPAGLAIAFYAQQAGIPAVLYEKSTALGGLCRTFRRGAHRYDSGAHRFHDQDPDITGDVRALLGDRLLAVNAPSKIYDDGRFIDFPPTPLNVILSSGIGPLARIGFDLVRARSGRSPRVTFADFAIKQFGETLARRYLLGYSEKVWGLPADQLSPDVATRRLNGMTLRSLFVELIAPSRKATHIDGEFLYPDGGYGEISAALAARIPSASIALEHEVTMLECQGWGIRWIHFAGRPPVEVTGRVASTLPISVLVRQLGDALPTEAVTAAARLRFRSIRLVWLRLRQRRVSTNASIYFPDPSLRISRVSEPKNRSAAMTPADETSLIAEVPCFAGDQVQRLTDQALAEQVIGELAGVGLIEPAAVIDWQHHFLPSAYPVYALDYADAVGSVLEALGTIENLDLLGRNGRFFYSHLHDQMRSAKQYIEALKGWDSERTGADQERGRSLPG